MRMKDWNRLGMLEEMKWAEDAQRNKIGQGNHKGMKWAKEAQNSVSTSPIIVPGLLKLSRRNVYSRPKRGPASTT